MNKKILIIEDDHDLLWLLNKFLKHQGYEVLTAVTGEQGIEVFTEFSSNLDAVILDLTLPDFDGEHISMEILKQNPEMSVIITSGLEDKNQKERLHNAGVSIYLQKPFNLSSLAKVLSEKIK